MGEIEYSPIINNGDTAMLIIPSALRARAEAAGIKIGTATEYHFGAMDGETHVTMQAPYQRYPEPLLCLDHLETAIQVMEGN